MCQICVTYSKTIIEFVLKELNELAIFTTNRERCYGSLLIVELCQRVSE